MKDKTLNCKFTVIYVKDVVIYVQQKFCLKSKHETTGLIQLELRNFTRGINIFFRRLRKKFSWINEIFVG